MKQESSFSEEKEAKRLHSLRLDRRLKCHARSEKFFGSFFQKRTSFPMLEG
jgi:hypothetical protein